MSQRIKVQIDSHLMSYCAAERAGLRNPRKISEEDLGGGKKRWTFEVDAPGASAEIA